MLCCAPTSELAREPLGAQVRPVLVNGTVGRMVTIDGRPHSVLAFTVVDGKIVEIDAIVARRHRAGLASASACSAGDVIA
jgi:hypothetical protein